VILSERVTLLHYHLIAKFKLEGSHKVAGTAFTTCDLPVISQYVFPGIGVGEINKRVNLKCGD
jgi:hypothetical protein